MPRSFAHGEADLLRPSDAWRALCASPGAHGRLLLEEDDWLTTTLRPPTEEEQQQCVVCLERPKTHILLPCGHKCAAPPLRATSRASA